jgi:hypothetical protein
MVLCLWAFSSYVYGEYKKGGKSVEGESRIIGGYGVVDQV